MGCTEYVPIARQFRVPVVITGFEPIDMLEGVLRCVRQLEAGQAEVENQYSRVVRHEGNLPAKKLLEEVFEVCDRKWRGVGSIPQSGYRLRQAFRDHDAERIFEVENVNTQESKICISGQILQGLKKPHQCPAFGKECTSQSPLGATMVSAEGACAAYYAYGRHLVAKPHFREAVLEHA
jgi:hydrogenase expression/formation protein HypD